MFVLDLMVYLENFVAVPPSFEVMNQRPTTISIIVPMVIFLTDEKSGQLCTIFSLDREYKLPCDHLLHVPDSEHGPDSNFQSNTHTRAS